MHHRLRHIIRCVAQRIEPLQTPAEVVGRIWLRLEELAGRFGADSPIADVRVQDASEIVEVELQSTFASEAKRGLRKTLMVTGNALSRALGQTRRQENS